MQTRTFSPGTVITNRSRLWRVDVQEGNVLAATTIDAGQPEQQKFYLPFENIQPSRLILPSADRLGHIQTQELLLQAYRLSLLHGAAPLVSLQRSRVIPKDYQLVPVVMALETPRVRMLLADDVGLGKTIEAGLIATELLARQMASRMLVIVPASLREQWREALDYFFHIDARIMSSRHRREMERELPAGANPWEYYPHLITSVDYAKQPAIKNQILEQRWDIVIFDEAHQVAKPHQSGPDQRVRMDRWELAQALAPHARHLLLLTATPHNGYTDSFASLLRMLEVGAIEGPQHDPQVIRSAAQRHVCQRRREDVELWFQDDPTKSPFPERDQTEVIAAPSQYEAEAIRAVQEYGERVLARAAEADRSSILAHWTVMHFHKRALSSPAALRQSLKNRRKRLEDRLARRLAAEVEESIPPNVARANVLDEDPGERIDDEEAGRRLERTFFGATKEAIRHELEQLEAVQAKAEKVTPSRDSKLQKLLDATLRERLRMYPKVIIFTRYVDTLNYLADQIGGDRRYADVKLVTIEGSMNERQRGEQFLAFERAKKAVLIATDAISEGINLQHAAAQIIHYELPWNPNRLEQRNGRVDRFGQRKPVVYIRTMVMDETLDAAILKVLIEKAYRIRRDYGFSPPYFGDETDVLELIRQHDIRIGPKQLSLFEDWGGAVGPEFTELPEQDPFSEETLERIKGDSFYGQTHISLPEIERRLQETAETVGSPEHIQRFVFSGLNRFGCQVTKNNDGSYRIAITDPNLQTASVGEVIERATLDPEAALDDPDLVGLDIGHPLVRRLIEEVKQNAFGFDTPDFDTLRYSAQAATQPKLQAEHYGRTAYVVTPAVDEVTALIHILARYVVNTDPISIIEELLPVAVPVYGGKPRWGETVRPLVEAEPTAETLPPADILEDLELVLKRQDLETLLDMAVNARLEELIAERRKLKQQMEAQGEGQLAWLQGIDDVSPASFDLLTVRLLYPVV